MRRNNFRFTSRLSFTPHTAHGTFHTVPATNVCPRKGASVPRLPCTVVHVCTYTIIHCSPSPGLTREGFVPRKDREDFTLSTVYPRCVQHRRTCVQCTYSTPYEQSVQGTPTANRSPSPRQTGEGPVTRRRIRVQRHQHMPEGKRTYMCVCN